MRQTYITNYRTTELQYYT